MVFLQTIEHIHDPGTLLDAIAGIAPVAYISTPNRLTLAAPGAEKSENPWHLREYDVGQYRELLEPHFSWVEILGLFHARKLAPHELAIKAGWDRVHAATHLTEPFYDRFIPAIAASDFRALPPTTWRRHLTSSPSAAADGIGDLAIVLHSHMPYVEGFGTYPFGEEWLFDAVARSHLPVLEVAERVTVTVTPVLADQLEADGVGERMLEFLRRHRLGAAQLDGAEDDPLRGAAASRALRAGDRAPGVARTGTPWAPSRKPTRRAGSQ